MFKKKIKTMLKTSKMKFKVLELNSRTLVIVFHECDILPDIFTEIKFGYFQTDGVSKMEESWIQS